MGSHQAEDMSYLPPFERVERHAYLFGHPIAHSMSPLLHRTVFQGLGLEWAQYPLDSVDIEDLLKRRQDPKFIGASVTMPHKVAILKHLDDITEEGRDVGACNTMFVRETNGKREFVGTNTDVVGIRHAFYKNISNPGELFEGRPGMVIGGGGAARSAVYAMRKWMKCDPIYIVNRDKGEVDAVISECKARGFGQGLLHVDTEQQAQDLEGPGAIVACVPDFPPKTENEKRARKVIETMLEKSHRGAILEMCYHPSPWTAVAEISEKAGWKVILGTEAMIWQGFEQDKFWTGRSVDDMPVQKVQEVIDAKLAEARRKV